MPLSFSARAFLTIERNIERLSGESRLNAQGSLGASLDPLPGVRNDCRVRGAPARAIRALFLILVSNRNREPQDPDIARV